MRDDALLAPRAARFADPPTMPDEQVRQHRPAFGREDLHEVSFDLLGGRLPGEAEAAGEPPDFVPLVRAWGGVTLAYRKRMVDSPAYRLNHEEIIKALLAERI